MAWLCPDTGEITVPAILSDEESQQVRAAGYRVEIAQDLEQIAAARLAEVNREANRFAPTLERPRSPRG